MAQSKSGSAVIITGASRGIGAATAILAAQQGFSVCVNYLKNAKAAEQVVENIVANGGTAISVAADVADPDDVEKMFARAQLELGNIVGLVNNAGILELQTDFAGINLPRLRRILETNVIGAFNCMQAGIKRMSVLHGGNGGSIVNVSSVAARTGAPHEYVDYAASKGALDAMTAGVAREVAAEGIRVNTVRPGFIYTDMHAEGGEPGRVDRLVSQIPLQRGGKAEDVAKAIVWLLSDKASYAVGTCIDVTGGV
jgi:NAD(P)-dependent dehydrogenase (short-subunit alcohol dehydrogenase family)